MNESGFRVFLGERNLSEEQIGRAVAIAARLEGFLSSRGVAGAAAASGEQMDAFSDRLVESGENTLDHYVALARYSAFVRNRRLYTAVLEYLDGHEALGNFHQRIGDALGEAARDEIFRGLPLPPLGTPNRRKPASTATAISRAERRDRSACHRILAGGLRDLKDEWFLDARRAYEESGGIDAYLARKGDEFIEELERHRQDGRWWFVQEITDEVVEYVRRNPEIRSGIRIGSIVYETKIPYLTKEYLAARDEEARRYYYCHCPWVRESFRMRDVAVPESFCLCSGAFHGRPYEVIFGRALQVDVVESVLRGDRRCRFAIHLPEGVV